jgi:hypothetical protein
LPEFDATGAARKRVGHADCLAKMRDMIGPWFVPPWNAEDALIAALKVMTEHPEAVITYVRQQNRRGDARHPSHTLAEALVDD